MNKSKLLLNNWSWIQLTAEYAYNFVWCSINFDILRFPIRTSWVLLKLRHMKAAIFFFSEQIEFVFLFWILFTELTVHSNGHKQRRRHVYISTHPYKWVRVNFLSQKMTVDTSSAYIWVCICQCNLCECYCSASHENFFCTMNMNGAVVVVIVIIIVFVSYMRYLSVLFPQRNVQRCR